MRTPLRPRDVSSFLLALAAVGCSSSVIGGFDDTVCLASEPGLGNLVPEGAADYVAVRVRPDYSEGKINVLGKWGTPCTQAADAAACQAALDALGVEPALLETHGFDGTTLSDIVFTRGDEVGRVATRDELLALLGTIDAPGEALLVAYAAGKNVVCGESNVRKVGSSYVLLGGDGGGCGEDNDIVRFEITVASDGALSTGEPEVIQEGDPNCAIGRRPPGLRSCAPRPTSVGSFFASAAHLEAASVPAFRHLANELAAHRAPRSLVRACLRSARDEIRHARVTTRLARRYGAAPARIDVAPTPVRSLVDIAVDNASEGMVKETFGAIVAGVQARCAIDPVVRRALAGIAVDEARHAALSYRIDAWIRGRLTGSEVARVVEARRNATAKLAHDASRAVPADVRLLAGMPGPAAQGRLLAAMRAGLGIG